MWTLNKPEIVKEKKGGGRTVHVHYTSVKITRNKHAILSNCDIVTVLSAHSPAAFGFPRLKLGKPLTL